MNDPKPRARFGIPLRLALLIGATALALAWLWPRLNIPPDGPITAALAFLAIGFRAFMWHIGVTGVALAACAWLLRHRATASVALALGLAALSPWLWSLRRAWHTPPPRQAGDLVVFSANTLGGSANPATLLADVRRVDADIIVLQEIPPEAATRYTDAFADAYVVAGVVTPGGGSGRLTLTRLDLAGPSVPYATASADPEVTWLPQLATTLAWNDGPLLVVNAHVMYPAGLRNVILQDRMARGVVEYLEGTDLPARVIIAGDLNSPIAAQPAQRFTDAGFRDARSQAGAGMLDSWAPFGLIGILPGTRIDHVLHRGGFTCVETGVGSRNGSDHRPVWARLRPAQ